MYSSAKCDKIGIEIEIEIKISFQLEFRTFLKRVFGLYTCVMCVYAALTLSLSLGPIKFSANITWMKHIHMLSPSFLIKTDKTQQIVSHIRHFSWNTIFSSSHFNRNFVTFNDENKSHWIFERKNIQNSDTHTQMRAYKYKMTREYLEMLSSERANEHNMTEC